MRWVKHRLIRLQISTNSFGISKVLLWSMHAFSWTTTSSEFHFKSHRMSDRSMVFYIHVVDPMQRGGNLLIFKCHCNFYGRQNPNWSIPRSKAIGPSKLYLIHIMVAHINHNQFSRPQCNANLFTTSVTIKIGTISNMNKKILKPMDWMP